MRLVVRLARAPVPDHVTGLRQLWASVPPGAEVTVVMEPARNA
jgi:hypothetical protein